MIPPSSRLRARLCAATPFVYMFLTVLSSAISNDPLECAVSTLQHLSPNGNIASTHSLPPRPQEVLDSLIGRPADGHRG
eukprot:11151-Eustigmatos_ZCMA.PRE.1